MIKCLLINHALKAERIRRRVEHDLDQDLKDTFIPWHVALEVIFDYQAKELAG